MDGKQHLKTLAALFDRDHHAHRRMLDDVVRLAVAGSHVTAAKLFGDAAQAIGRHMIAEEQVLDGLETEGHCPRSVLNLIIVAHAQIKDLIDDARAALIAGDENPLAHALSSLQRAIAAHERTEQEELLPLLCACYANPAELDRVARHILGSAEAPP